MTPFCLVVGLALVCGYELLRDQVRLVVKTDGALQDWARRWGRRCLVGVVLGILIVSLWTPLIDPRIASRWFSWPNIALLAPVPIITAALVGYEWKSLSDGSEHAPFIVALALFAMAYLGIAISLWPMIVPGHFTLEQAASSQSTQAFLLIGTLFLLPVILMYTGWSYWVFAAKSAPTSAITEASADEISR